ncbi:MAG: effector binding domain-containing protein [Clostridia bacterium]|nr:effector binding domain-containing protein [Clostridia bacterium]
MDWITGLQRAIDYVEEHLTEEIDYEEAAKQAYSSSFHFQRIFSTICGFSLGDYIRCRRLSLAGSELAVTDIKVIDAALKYGYDSTESFSRAFTRFHGVTPSQAKKGAALKSFSELSVKIILHGGKAMDYRIEKKEAFEVVLRKKHFPKQHEITTQEISKFWAQCGTDGTIPAICKYIPKDNIFDKCIIGISFGTDGDVDEFPYGIGAHYNGQEITEDYLTVEKIPAHTYAVFKCKGEMPGAFQKVYKYICTEFFPASEYQPCGVEIECYPSADVHNPEFTCEIWIAVKPKD